MNMMTRRSGKKMFRKEIQGIMKREIQGMPCIY